jgi:hypothetical protein
MIISRYLKASPDLAAVTQHAERLLELQHFFAAIAPPALAQQCRVANFKQGKLVIHAANALFAAKLRQVIPSLSEEFLNRGWQVTAIQVAVQQSSDEPQAPVEIAPLPPAARARLAEFSNQINDKHLKASLEHLLEIAAPTEEKEPDSGSD